MGRRTFRRVGIIAKPHSPHARTVLRRLVRGLDRRQVAYLCDPGAATALSSKVGETDRDEIYRNADLLIILGGDGTLLSVARDIAALGIPILGVNLGSLGFLTEVTLGELDESVDGVLAGAYRIDRRMMLEARLYRRRRRIAGHHLLNDVVLNKSALARIIDIDISIDGRYVTSYRADGLIVCTPTGSTAYSLSAGGPILQPSMRSFCLTPICPHTLTNRPLVVPSSAVIDIRLRKGSDEDVFLTLDGQVGMEMQASDRVQIRRSRHAIRLVQPSGKTFFDVLRNKLKWGGQ